MSTKFRYWVLLGVLCWLVMAGCSSDSDGTVTSVGGGTVSPVTSARTVIVAHTAGAAKAVRARGVPPEVDTLEFTGRDSRGSVVYGWTRREFAPTVTLTDVPPSVRTLHIDYLRNAGYALRTVDVPVDLSGGPVTVVDPPHTAATAATSSFQFTGPSPLQQVVATYPDTPGATPTAHNIQLKGVCYAPTPIGANINFLQLLSDLFYDLPPVTASPSASATPGLPPSWLPYAQGSPTNDVNPAERGDIEDIRTNLQCNAMRVYAVMAHALNGNPSQSLTQTYTHQAFLDQCWNNGHNPIFVLADFPMPEFMFFNQDSPDSYGASWWEQNLVDTVSSIGQHPALLGVIIMNEHIGSGNSFITTPAGSPSPGASVPPAPSNQYQATPATDYFYSQCQNFIKDIKGGGPKNPGSNIAPGKLVGWAINDNPTQMNYINYAYDTTGRTPYASYLSGFDFWGVNTYQPVNLDSVLSPNSLPTGTTPGSNSSYGQLTNCQKPVLFTEIGYSAAAHATPGNGLVENSTVAQNVANTITSLIGQQAFGNSRNYSPNLFAGSFYFEYSDEWWKTDSAATQWVWNTALSFTSGPYPNGYNIQDEAAFGLNGLTLGPGRSASNPNNASGPNYPLDVLGRQLPQVVPTPAPSPFVQPVTGSNPRAVIQQALYDVYK